jgi:hypothetical protein
MTPIARYRAADDADGTTNRTGPQMAQRDRLKRQAADDADDADQHHRAATTQMTPRNDTSRR